MADPIDIAFKVSNDELKAGLDKALQDVAKTSADLKQKLTDLEVNSKRTLGGLLSFDDARSSSEMTSTKRKADEETFAIEAAHVQELRTLNQLSADEAIRQQRDIENAKLKQSESDIEADYRTNEFKKGAYEKYQEQIDQIRLRHDAAMRQLDQKSISEAMQSWQRMLGPISNAFSSSLSGMITGQQNFSQALRNIGNSIVSDFVNMAVKRATNWIASELIMTQATEAGDAARAASQTSADAAGKAAQAASGSATVFGDANKAASGAYSAVAGIPYVGPILAPAAAVAAFAAVMAYDVFSAEGGFDIPAGLNPMTQLHEREMVLPAHIAEPLRAGLSGGNRPMGGDIHIHAVDAASFQRLLMDNKSALARALRGAHRSFDPALA